MRALGGAAQTVTVRLTTPVSLGLVGIAVGLALTGALVAGGPRGSAVAIRDLWQKQDLGTTKTPLSAEVQGHDVLLVRLDKI